MKRPRRTYRLHEDIQLGIEHLSRQYKLGLGEVIEKTVESELRAAIGRDWRETVREQGQGRRVATTPTTRLRPYPQAAPEFEVEGRWVPFGEGYRPASG